MNPALAIRHTGTLKIVGGLATGAIACLAGVLVAADPAIGIALSGLILVTALTFLAPVAHLIVLLLITAVVPFGILNMLGPGGAGSAGVAPSDMLLLTGLARAGTVLIQTPMDRRRLLTVGLILAFFVVVALQIVHGTSLGRSASAVGYEGRVLLGFGTVLVAMPIVADPPARGRLIRGLLGIAVLIGLWGMAQLALNLEEVAESGVGVREGVSGTTAGRGSLQGALYGYPVAAMLLLAALLSGSIRSSTVRGVLVAGLILNLASILLTFERTFWIGTLLGAAFITVRAGRGRRIRALVWACMAAALMFSVIAIVAPTELTSARERLLLIGRYESDDAVRTRLIETRLLLNAIDERPVVGSGLGATIFWGQPWNQVPPTANWHAENGYLWVAWKLGIPAAVFLVFLLGWAVIARGPPERDELSRSVRVGSQAALFVLLISTVAFPTFISLTSTPMMGVLAAISLAPLGRRPAEAAPYTAWAPGNVRRSAS